jgi:hypothetical protein
MILNTYLKNQNVILPTLTKAKLGISIARRFKTIYPNVEFKKVRIKEGEKSFEVVDYPKDFLENPRTKRIVERFVLKGKKMRETRKAVTKKD